MGGVNILTLLAWAHEKSSAYDGPVQRV